MSPPKRDGDTLPLGCLFSLFLLAITVAPLGLQVALWLQDGYWTSFSVIDVLVYLCHEEKIQICISLPPFDWKGVEKVVYWLLDQHISIYLFMLAGGILWVTFFVNDAIDPEE